MALELLLSDHRGDCRPPCVEACPAHTDCQGYVGLIANGEYKEALKVLKEIVPLPASIGRVCPHPCESACRRKLVEQPLAIAQLKTFIADLDLADENPFLAEKAPSSGKRVAVIGGGLPDLPFPITLRGTAMMLKSLRPCPKPGECSVTGSPISFA